MSRVTSVADSGETRTPYTVVNALITELGEIYATVPTEYTIYKSGSNYIAKCAEPDGTDYTSTSSSTVIQNAFDALSSGRTWKEKVVIKGNIALDAKIVPPSYTILEIHGKVTIANNFDDDIIENSDPAGGNTQIDIIVYGVLDGNSAGQTTAGMGINFYKVTDSTISVYGKIYDTFADGIYMNGCDRNQIPIVHIETTGGKGIQLENCEYNQLGLIFVKDTDKTGVLLYLGSNYNTIDTVTSINAGVDPDVSNGGEGFRIDNDCSYNIIGKVYSYNSAYEGVRIEVNSVCNQIGLVTINTTGNTAGIDGIEIYDGADKTVINAVNIKGVRGGQGILIDGSDSVLVLGGTVDGTGCAAATEGVVVYNSNDCEIGVHAFLWDDSGCHVKGSSARTLVRGNYCGNGDYGVEESDTADYTLLDCAVLIGNTTGTNNVDALHSVVGSIVV